MQNILSIILRKLALDCFSLNTALEDDFPQRYGESIQGVNHIEEFSKEIETFQTQVDNKCQWTFQEELSSTREGWSSRASSTTQVKMDKIEHFMWEARWVLNVIRSKEHKRHCCDTPQALQGLTLLRRILFKICLIDHDKTKGSNQSGFYSFLPILTICASFRPTLPRGSRTYATRVLQHSSVLQIHLSLDRK